MALRRAIGDDPRRPRWLHTVRGEGYRLTVE
jgi:DNA-binding response OmpR family regulator